jgi:hypothetical protein
MIFMSFVCRRKRREKQGGVQADFKPGSDLTLRLSTNWRAC